MVGYSITAESIESDAGGVSRGRRRMRWGQCADGGGIEAVDFCPARAYQNCEPSPPYVVRPCCCCCCWCAAIIIVCHAGIAPDVFMPAG